jgi:nicotinamidase-related amidase
LKPIILVIDMQGDFVSSSSPVAVRHISGHLAKFKTFIEKARIAGIAIGYTRHCFDPKQNPIEGQKFPAMNNGCLKKGTPGWSIIPELAPAPGEIVIDKTRYDAFFGTNLDTNLRQRSIDTLILTGTMTEVCVESTARSAMYLDYNVQVLSDLTFSNDQGKHDASLRVISSHFGLVKNSSEIGGTLAKPEVREMSLRSRWAGI